MVQVGQFRQGTFYEPCGFMSLMGKATKHSVAVFQAAWAFDAFLPFQADKKTGSASF